MDVSEIREAVGELAEDIRETASKGASTLDPINELHGLHAGQKEQLEQAVTLLGRIASLMTDVRHANEEIAYKRTTMQRVSQIVASNLAKHREAVKGIQEGSSNPVAEEIATQLATAHSNASTGSETIMRYYGAEGAVPTTRKIETAETSTQYDIQRAQERIREVDSAITQVHKAGEHMETSVTHANNAAGHLDDYIQGL